MILARRGAVGLSARASADAELSGESEPGTFTALFFERSLEELGLEPGELPLLRPDAPGPSRGAPEFVASSWIESGGSAWIPGFDPRTLEVLRLPIIDRRRCAERGGCFTLDQTASEESLFCATSCRVPEPTPPAPPEPPELPALPSLLPCPAGWVEAIDAGSTVCAPSTRGPETPCPDGFARFGRNVECARVGDECPPVGEFGDLPDDSLFVSSLAVGGGDGTRARPLQRLTEAFPLARPGQTIALSVGFHDAPGAFAGPLTIVGACAAGSRIVGAPQFAAAVVTTGTVSVSNVRVSGAERAFDASSSATFRLENVIIDDVQLGVVIRGAGELIDVAIKNTSAAVSVPAGILRAQRISIEASGDYPIAATDGAIVDVTDFRIVGADRGVLANSATLVLRSGLLRATVQPSVNADIGAHVTVEDVEVDGTSISVTAGVWAAGGSTLVASRLAVSNVPVGISVCGARTTASITDVRADGIQARAGAALLSCDQASSRVSRLSSAEFARGLSARGGEIFAEDVEIARAGEAVGVDASSRAEIARARIRESETAVLVRPEGTAHVTDLTVTEALGRGVVAQGTVELERAAFSGLDEYAVRVELGALTIADLTIDDCGRGGGTPIFLGESQCTLRAERVAASGRSEPAWITSSCQSTIFKDFRVTVPPGNRTTAIAILGERSTVDRIMVDGGDFGLMLSSEGEASSSATGSDLSFQRSGRCGLGIFHRCQAELSNISIRETAGTGLQVIDEAKAVVDNVRVSSVGLGQRGGSVILLERGVLDLKEFVIEDGEVGGLVFAGAASLVDASVFLASDGRVRGNRVGAEARGTLLDFRRFMLGVVYEDNGTTFVGSE